MFLSTLLSSFFDRIPYPDADGEKYYLYEELWTEYAENTLSSVFLYAALALALILTGIGIFVKLKRAESFIPFIKTSLTIAVTFAVTVIITMLAIGFAKISEKGYLQEKVLLLELIPPLVFGASVVLGSIACYVASFFSKKTYKITLFSSLSVMAAALLATVVCLAIYYSRAIAGDGYYDSEEYGKLNQVALYLSAAGLTVAAVAAAFALDRKNKFGFDSKCIALAGICVALSFALSYIKIFSMPQGGSVTLASLLPVMLFSYIYGTRKGLFVGLIYGMMQAMQNAYLIHPAQFFLDYPIAFAMAGFAGAFKNLRALDKLPQIKFALGAVAAGSLRFLSHVLSGVFAFGAYAVDAGNQNFWAYSTAYNSYVFIDIILVIAVGALLLSSRNFNRQVNRFTESKANAAPAAQSAPETEQ